MNFLKKAFCICVQRTQRAPRQAQRRRTHVACLRRARSVLQAKRALQACVRHAERAHTAPQTRATREACQRRQGSVEAQRERTGLSRTRGDRRSHHNHRADAHVSLSTALCILYIAVVTRPCAKYSAMHMPTHSDTPNSANCGAQHRILIKMSDRKICTL